MTDAGHAQLSIENLSVVHRRRRQLRPADKVRAVDAVSLAIAAGTTCCLVGESGSGKTSLARAVLGITRPSSGVVRLDGVALAADVGRRSRAQRRALQVVFQDPMRALTPTSTVAELIGEPLRLHEGLTGARLQRAVSDALEAVALPTSISPHRPAELSGGQRQRVVLARALAARPAVVVLDEPVTALDVSTQGQVMNLLGDLQRDHGLTYLLIAHDLTLACRASDRIAVMYRGRLVEVGDAAAVRSTPQHPYSRDLLDAVPVPDPVRQRQRRAMRAAAHSFRLDDGTHRGCLYSHRCDRATEQCVVEAPSTVEVRPGWSVACHHPLGLSCTDIPSPHVPNPSTEVLPWPASRSS
jgi:oligopeptide/dipeptide ABC transporter ATP-binding protein